jgi:XTP/dITP diphosphohydrolase
LVVDYLGGEPGVCSARYCGRHGDDLANNELLLERLTGVPSAQRTARFVAAVALVGPKGQETVVTGECPGLIATEMRGQGGFGYDSLFLLPELGLTFAELSAAQKDAVSHRARAFAKIAEALRERVKFR